MGVTEDKTKDTVFHLKEKKLEKDITTFKQIETDIGQVILL